MITQPFVAIIMPVYRTERYLPEALDSVLRQTYKNFIVVAVNDGSPDNSQQILEEYSKKDHRVIVIKKTNGGVASARNAALDFIEKTNATHIGFLDSDDRLDENCLEECLTAIRETDADAVFFATLPFDKTGDKLDKLELPEARSLTQQEVVHHYFRRPRNPSGSIDPTVNQWLSSRFFKASILKNMRFDETLRVAEDGLFFLNSLKNINKAVIIPKFFLHYRLRKSSLSHGTIIQYDILKAHKKYKSSQQTIECTLPYIERSIRDAWWNKVLQAVRDDVYCSEKKYLSELARDFKFSTHLLPLTKRDRFRLFLYSLGGTALKIYLRLKGSRRRAKVEDMGTYFD